MKKIICGLLVTLTSISLMACAGEKESEKKTEITKEISMAVDKKIEIDKMMALVGETEKIGEKETTKETEIVMEAETNKEIDEAINENKEAETTKETETAKKTETNKEIWETINETKAIEATKEIETTKTIVKEPEEESMSLSFDSSVDDYTIKYGFEGDENSVEVKSLKGKKLSEIVELGYKVTGWVTGGNSHMIYLEKKDVKDENVDRILKQLSNMTVKDFIESDYFDSFFGEIDFEESGNDYIFSSNVGDKFYI